MQYIKTNQNNIGYLVREGGGGLKNGYTMKCNLKSILSLVYPIPKITVFVIPKWPLAHTYLVNMTSNHLNNTRINFSDLKSPQKVVLFMILSLFVFI